MMIINKDKREIMISFLSLLSICNHLKPQHKIGFSVIIFHMKILPKVLSRINRRQCLIIELRERVILHVMDMVKSILNSIQFNCFMIERNVHLLIIKTWLKSYCEKING